MLPVKIRSCLIKISHNVFIVCYLCCVACSKHMLRSFAVFHIQNYSVDLDETWCWRLHQKLRLILISVHISAI